MRPAVRLSLFIASLAPLAACRAELESGYQYRRLSSTPGDRKAYYAPAFSPESKAASAERQDEFRSRKPGGGY